jgi:hypothetical protein
VTTEDEAGACASNAKRPAFLIGRDRLLIGRTEKPSDPWPTGHATNLGAMQAKCLICGKQLLRESGDFSSHLIAEDREVHHDRVRTARQVAECISPTLIRKHGAAAASKTASRRVRVTGVTQTNPHCRWCACCRQRTNVIEMADMPRSDHPAHAA